VADLADELLAEGVLGPLDLGAFYPDLGPCALFCFTEMVPREEIDRVVGLVGDIAGGES
jgi:glycine dehydrogenase subunit 1